MKNTNILKVLIFALVLQSCASILGTTSSNEGETAYQAGEYEKALNYWEQSIISRESKGKKAKAPAYVGGGKSALALGQVEKAKKYLESAYEQNFSSAELYASLAELYKEIDNLSKEIRFLEYYHNQYPEGEEISKINARLFGTYVESENWDLANKLWPEIEAQAESNINLMAGYLIVNKALGNSTKGKELAQKILDKDASNVIALEWYADYYYWKAENSYVKEMKAYKNKRTTSQYNKLLKALEKVYPNFRKSRDYYLKLYKATPKKEYAKKLGNIYTRLGDKQKAAYYNKKAK